MSARISQSEAGPSSGEPGRFHPRPGSRAALAALVLFMMAFMAAVFALGIRATIGKAPGPAQYAVSFASLLPLGYAFSAGMVASVNPCGFMLLPAFVGYHLGRGEPGKDSADLTLGQLGRGALFGVVVTLGFMAFFTAIGSIVATGGTAIVGAFPWVGLAVGIIMAALGLWLLLTGRSLGIPWLRLPRGPGGRGLGSVFLYGVGYGAASLSCTLPIFLVVVATSLTTGGVLDSLAHFAGFGLGMGAVVIAVSLSAVAFRGAVAGTLQDMVPHVHRLSAVFLAGAGAYLVVYWVFLGRVFS